MIYRFGAFELDEARYELRRAGVLIPIERRVFDLLTLLVRSSGRVVAKAEIFACVWSGRIVSDGSLTVAVSAARKALGDDATRQESIRTCPGRGYELTQPVFALPDTASAARLTDLSQHFVGRTEEILLFDSLIESALPTVSDVVVISGEPGLGKSRLLSEYARRAALRSLPMHIVPCPESERTPFLWPCVQLIRKLAQHGDANWKESLHATHAAFLSRLLPELISGKPANLASDPAAASFQLFESIAALLRSLCRDQRPVLAIDDFHRADEATARFIQFAVQEFQSLPFLLVVTHRPAEVAQSTVHFAAISALTRRPAAMSLALKGLSAAETAELASVLSSDAAHDLDAQDLRDHTGGNPFFIRQLVPLLPLQSNTRRWTSLPPSVSHLIAERVSALTAATQDVLGAASVVGREFAVPLLRKLLTTVDVDLAFDEAIESGLIASRPENRGTMTFQHVLVRNALYERLPIEKRRDIHRRVADLLVESDLSEVAMGTVAHHLVAAGSKEDLARALEISERAAHAADRSSAHEDAIHHLQKALDALPVVDPRNQRRHLNLLLRRGEAECRSGRRSDARATFREAGTLAKALGASHELARAALGMAPGFLAAEAGISDAALEELLAEAMASLGSSDFRLKAQIAARLAMALHWSERDAQMHELIGLARELLREDPDPHVQLYVLFAEWFCEWNPSESTRRAAIADRICALAHELCDREMYLVGTMLRLVSMLERAEISGFDAALSSFESLAEHLRQPQSLWYASMYKAMRSLLDGDFDQVRALQQVYSKIAARVNDANAFHSLAAQAGLLHWETGSLDTMIDAIAEGARRYPTIRGFRAGLAWASAKTGREQEARREFARLASSNFRDLPRRYDWSTAVAFAAETCVDLRDQDRAQVLYEILEPLQGKMLVLGLGVASYGSADRLLALLSKTMGRLEQAEWHFDRALELTSGRMPLWNAHTKVDYAAFLLRHRRSSRTLVAKLSREARAVAASLGARSLADGADQVLALAEARSAS